ncbi:MAG: cellulase family glycosylhydrolase, partial [Candidatus Hydrogenedentes bacterium]|nr:cellulase family glycosylhydrolase [Candidatus Hydrogenedentota bacterium]
EIYRAVLDAQTAANQAFEREKLQPMYQRVANAIREADTKHILFMEPSYHCNAGVPCALEPLVLKDGSRDPQQALASHGYDIVVDTPDQAKASGDRIALIFERHGETAARAGLPLLIGEWGAYGGGGAELLPVARMVTRQFEQLLCGDTYWEFGKNIDKTGTFPALQRPIPIALAGTLISYEHDAANGTFTCRWRESANITAPTRIYLPQPMGSTPSAMVLAPEGEGFTVEDAIPGSRNSVVVIPVSGAEEDRTFTWGGKAP